MRKMADADNALEPTVFHEPWWLEIASAGRYNVSEVTNGGKTVGRLPYMLHKRFGIASLDMPMLTHFLGPSFLNITGSPNTIFLRKLAITRELLQKLPAVSLTRMKLHHGITDAVAFQEQGFRTSVQFTHEIAPLPEDSLWANMRNKTRNVIRRAQEHVRLAEVTDVGSFMQFYATNLKRRGLRNFLDRPTCTRLLEEAIGRGRGRILAAYEGNQLLAANFYLWDRSSYYFMLTTRSLMAGNGTTSLLLWEAIKDAAQRGLIFDSDGLNSTGGILFLAGLGGVIKPRYIVTKAKLPGLILQTYQEAIWGKNFFVRG